MRARATALKVRWRFCEHGMLRKIAPWDQRFQCSAPLASFLLSSIFSASSRPLCDQDRSLSRRRDPVALTRGRKRLLGEVRSSSRERPCSSRSCGITGPRPCQGGGSAQRDAERGGAALTRTSPGAGTWANRIDGRASDPINCRSRPKCCSPASRVRGPGR
jgi:hypothetical protein